MLVVLAHLFIFLLGAIVLSKSATYLVRTVTQLGILFKLSEFSIAFILMSFATSLPELSVGVSAALEGKPILSLGTIFGSNIADLTIIIGLPALIAGGIRIESQVRNRDIFYVALISIIPLVLILDGLLSRVDGLAILVLFIFYIFRLFGQQEKHTKRLGEIKDHPSIIRHFGYFFIEVLALILSATLLVKLATFIASDLKIPLVLVGLAIVALGTTLPELSFELFTLTKRQSGLALGNILGSVVTNSCLILGITALISPIEVASDILFLVSAIFFMLVLLIFISFIRSQYKLTWREGMILVFIYALFILVEFSIESSLSGGS